MHIGEKISEVLKLKHMTKQELGRTLGMSGSAATYLTTRPSIDAETLQKIGTAVNYNFFRHYPVEESAGDGSAALTAGDKVIEETKQRLMEKDRIIVALKREIVLQKQENDYLKKINSLLEMVVKK